MKCLITAANVGKDAEVKSLDGGSYQIRFSVCENERKKGDNGEVISEPHWYSCLYYTRSAKVGEHIRKGTKVCVWGDFKYSVYTNDQSGEKRLTFDIFVTELKIIAFAADTNVDVSTGEVKEKEQPVQQQYASQVPPASDVLPF